MRVRVLGSGASEGIPAIFCNCASCQNARKAGGKNIRTRSQFFIDDDMMIDFGDDTFYHSLRNNISLSKLKRLLITHSHADHYNPVIFKYRGGSYAPVISEEILYVHSTPAVLGIYNQLERGKPSAEVSEKINFSAIQEFEPFLADKYKIHALLADHVKTEKCYLYLVEKDGKRVLFGNDSAFYPDETFEYLKGVHIDLAFLDCTYGLNSKEDNEVHMNFHDNLRVKERFFANGTADGSTIFVSTHFTHLCNATHEEMYDEMKKYGFLPAYDSMLINDNMEVCNEIVN